MDDAPMPSRIPSRMPLAKTLRSRPVRAAAPALAVAFAALMAGQASAQTLFFGWGPSPDYGYRPPAPIYRPVGPRYVPVPSLPDDDFAGAQTRRLTGTEVSRMLRARGMEVSSAPVRNGGVYVAEVVDRAGRPRRLIVDGYYGRVLQTFPGGSVGEAPRAPGPRFAGRPPEPDVDTDALQPGEPKVIPGVGPNAAEPRQKPKAGQAQPRKPVKSAAKPSAKPSAMPSAMPSAVAPAVKPPVAAPDAPAPVSAEPAPVQSAPGQAAPSGAAPAPVAAPVDSAPASPAPAASTASTAPAEPVTAAPNASTAEPPAGQTAPENARQSATPPAETPDRPRRRVRFIKPDSPTIADPNVPGGQLVPIPEPPPVNLTPRSAEAPATGQQQ